MSDSLIDNIVSILKEKDYTIVAKALKQIEDIDRLGTENFLYDIILERDVYRPQDIPFSIARYIWKRDDTNAINDKDLLNEILEYPIADINRAKINDFLWVVEGDYAAAKSAETYYRIQIESTEEFEYNFMAINRLIHISKKINSKDIDGNARKELLTKVLNQYHNEDHGKILYLIQTAVNEKLDVDFLFQYTENILNTYDDQSFQFDIIGKFCDILEKLYCEKNKLTKKRCISDPKLSEIRRRKVRAIMRAESSLNTGKAGNMMQSIDLLKEAVNILKTVEGTEVEQKEVLKRIDEMQKQSVCEMHVFSKELDCTDIVKQLRRELEILDKEEAICYFVSFIPLPEISEVETSVKKSLDSPFALGGLVQKEIIGIDGKTIAKGKPLKKDSNDTDSVAFQKALERRTVEFIRFYSQILIGNAFNYIYSKFEIEEKDIRQIVENCIFIPEDRRESYIKGIMAGFSGDLLTALYILTPQAENLVREIAKECGETIYNMNEEGIEELKTLHAILALDGIKERLDDDFLLIIKTVFCSKFGFNMRNNVAHGLLSDKQCQSYDALYTWWLILKMCYMFCGKLQVDNRIKVNDKLRKQSENV